MRAFVLMGVSGSGKSTIGIHAAARLAWPYLDADDFGRVKDLDKMTHRIPLSDADQAPWIEDLSHAINRQVSPCVIVACSGLARLVRHRLEDAVQRPISFMYLRASPDTLARRLRERHHFIRNDLLTNQLEALEIPPEAFEINADDGIDVVTGRLVSRIRMLAGVLRPHP